MKKRILFVDDEPNVLQGLKRSLRQMAHEWEMDFADGGAAALEKFEQAPFDVIVSDIRMPQMDGVELLGHVRDQYPQAIRIALTGQTSHEAALRSAGTAHQFLNKPCDPTALIASVCRATELRRKLKQESLQQLIAGITTLPSVPHLYHEIVRELQKPDASMQRIADLIAADIAMTAKLLQLVNSSFFGLAQRVTKVSQAVTLLGADTIKALTLSVGVFSQCTGSQQRVDELAKHSIMVGASARRIAESQRMSPGVCDDSFMAGVLHDVGKLVLFSSFPDAYEEAFALMEQHDLEPTEVELSIFGASHADVGAALLAMWAFPDATVEAVAFHHQPSNCVNAQFAPLTAVHVANALLEADDQHADRLDMAYLERLGLVEKLEGWKQCCTANETVLPEKVEK